tara:strand:+ start:1497 stop:1892 length:396 start_codon:yes stop_codon:yes gene_type:complete
MKWSKKDVEKLKNKGIRVKGAEDLVDNRPVGLVNILNILDEMSIEYVEEYRFHKTRRWRFDVAILNINVAIEYEGIVGHKSRHTSITGYTKDCEKYNNAAILGWKVLRYTALNYEDLTNDLGKVLSQDIGS